MTTGRLVRAFVGGRTVRLVAVEVAAVAERARLAHALDGNAARLAAEGLVATALMGAHIKGDECISLHIQASRPRFSFIGDMRADGEIRARFSPTRVVGETDDLDGVMIAIKSVADREVYRGHTEVRGTLAASLASHLASSQQVDSILRIEVVVDAGTIVFAGGLIVERLPEHAEHPWVPAEEFRERYASVRSDPLRDTLTGLAFGKVAGGEVELLEDRGVEWRCRCSRDRVRGMLLGLGAEELSDMLQEQGEASVNCHFCNKLYHFAGDELRQLLVEA